MKNKKLVVAVVAMTMCATSALAFSACNNHEHDYQDWHETKAPTCIAKGEETGTCAEDGETSIRYTDIDPDAHAYGEWAVTNPTRTTEGKAYKTCANSAEHVVEVTLPKLNEESKYKSVTPKTAGDKEGEQTYVFAHALGDITFKATPSHNYEGELTLVKAPTFSDYGYATQKCSVDETHDVLKIYLPHLLAANVYEVKDNTDTTKSDYTFTHTDGQKVTVEAVTNPLSTTVGAKLTAGLAQQDKVGRVSGTNTSYVAVHAGNQNHGITTSPVSYGFGDNYTFVDGEYEYHAYKDGEDITVYQKNKDNDKLAQLPTHSSVKKLPEEQQALISEFYDGYIYGAPFTYAFGVGEQETLYGVNLLSKLYDFGKNTNPNGDFVEYSYDDEGTTVYAFSYGRFSHYERQGKNKGGEDITIYSDAFYKTNVSFTLGNDDMITSFKVETKSYGFNYDKDGTVYVDTGTSLVPKAGETNNLPATLIAENPIKGYDTGKYYIDPDAEIDASTVIEINQAAKDSGDPVESPYDFDNLNITSFDLQTYDWTVDSFNDLPETVKLTTKNNIIIYVKEVTPESAADYLDLNMFYVKVTAINSEGEEFEISDPDNTEEMPIGCSVDGGMITLSAVSDFGEYTIKVEVGGVVKTFKLNTSLAAPDNLLGQVYNDNEGSYEAESADSVVVVGGGNAYIGANAVVDPYADYETDVSYTVAVKGGATGVTVAPETITVGEEQVTAYKVTASAAGTYTIVFTSNADSDVTCEVTVYVFASAEDVPADQSEDVLAALNGSWTYSYELDYDYEEYDPEDPWGDPIISEIRQETVTYTLKFENGKLYVQNSIEAQDEEDFEEFEFNLVAVPDGETYKIALLPGEYGAFYLQGVDPEKVDPAGCYVKWSGTAITEFSFSIDVIVELFYSDWMGLIGTYDEDGYHTVTEFGKEPTNS